jgi:hypothetical protein
MLAFVPFSSHTLLFFTAYLMCDVCNKQAIFVPTILADKADGIVLLASNPLKTSLAFYHTNDATSEPSCDGAVTIPKRKIIGPSSFSFYSTSTEKN